MAIFGLLCERSPGSVSFQVIRDSQGQLVLEIITKGPHGPLFDFRLGTAFNNTWLVKKNGENYIRFSLYPVDPASRKLDEGEESSIENDRSIYRFKLKTLIEELTRYENKEPGFYNYLLESGTTWCFIYQYRYNGMHDSSLKEFTYKVDP